MRLGILGGTFDPIHIGHLIIAEEARVRLDLEEVLFIPTGQPWLKADIPISPAHHRLEMVRLAVVSNPYFRVSTMELDRPGPSYTMDTLDQLRQEMGSDAQFYFILGLDSLREFHRWKDPEGILERCTLVAMGRPGYDNRSFPFQESLGQLAAEKVIFLDAPRIEISGTELRRRVSQGISIRYWVPQEVEGCIQRHGLYKNPRPPDLGYPRLKAGA